MRSRLYYVYYQNSLWGAATYADQILILKDILDYVYVLSVHVATVPFIVCLARAAAHS